jgi:hypothetical protein
MIEAAGIAGEGRAGIAAGAGGADGDTAFDADTSTGVAETDVPEAEAAVSDPLALVPFDASVCAGIAGETFSGNAGMTSGATGFGSGSPPTPSLGKGAERTAAFDCGASAGETLGRFVCGPDEA